MVIELLFVLWGWFEEFDFFEVFSFSGININKLLKYS